MNAIHTKWHYIFNIEELRNKRKNVFKTSSKPIINKPVSKNNLSEESKKEVLKKEVNISNVLETLYKNDMKKYSSYDKYDNILKDNAEYYSSPIVGNHGLGFVLLKKIVCLKY